MGLFGRFKLNRAIRRYAAELPRRLYADYGAAAFYTPAQVATATRKLKVDPAVLVYGCAMFLNEDAYNALPSNTRNQITYEDARTTFIASMPSQPRSTGNFYESGLGMNGAGFTDSGPSNPGF
jgi:hypothetical protein